MRQSDISIIVPFLNEEANITNLAKKINDFVELNSAILFEIILVNDGSTDSSKEIIRRTKFSTRTTLVNFSQNYGSHAALRAGISIAKGKNVTFLYADLQDPIINITKMYAEIQKGSDIVWAYREKSKGSKFERLFSKLYSTLMIKFVNKKYPVNGFDIVMFNSKVAVELNRNIESNSSVFLQILTLGFRSHHIYYQKENRQAGKSKWTVSKKIKLLIDSFVAFSFAPIRLVSLMGIIFFILGIAWSLYILLRKILFDDLVSGWPALMSVLMVGFGVTNISLGILAEYLWRTLDASRKRPVFVIDEIIEL